MACGMGLVLLEALVVLGCLAWIAPEAQLRPRRRVTVLSADTYAPPAATDRMPMSPTRIGRTHRTRPRSRGGQQAMEYTSNRRGGSPVPQGPVTTADCTPAPIANSTLSLVLSRRKLRASGVLRFGQGEEPAMRSHCAGRWRAHLFGYSHSTFYGVQSADPAQPAADRADLTPQQSPPTQKLKSSIGIRDLLPADDVTAP